MVITSKRTNAEMKKNRADMSEQVFLEYKSKIDRYITEKGVMLSDRDDIFSEILLKATHQAALDNSAKISVCTWIYTITRSIVINYFKKRKEKYPLTESQPSDFDLEGRVELETELSELARHLARLPEREKRVIVLRLYGDMEYREIAKAMNVSEVNARKIYSRALKKLRMSYGVD